MFRGGLFFFTIVTWQRIPILTTPQSREALRNAIQITQEKYPFEMDAICLLPEHIHCTWNLPEEDFDYSIRWRYIKALFSRFYREYQGKERTPTKSRTKRRETGIWQRRFWDHMIRDEDDYYAHLDYIHYNPVKHGLVQSVRDWPWSSFHRYVQLGLYEPDWGSDITLPSSDSFGE